MNEQRVREIVRDELAALEKTAPEVKLRVSDDDAKKIADTLLPKPSTH